jgi:hypothetical protein
MQLKLRAHQPTNNLLINYYTLLTTKNFITMHTQVTDYNLQLIFDSLHHFLIPTDAGDVVYRLTRFHQSYSDESYISVLTFGINQHMAVDLEEFSKILSEHLPRELREPFIQEEHLLLVNIDDSLAIHLNDHTITLILHGTGQY